MILKIDSTMYRLETPTTVDLELVVKVIKKTIYQYEYTEGIDERLDEGFDIWDDCDKVDLITYILEETVGDYTLTEIKHEPIIEF